MVNWFHRIGLIFAAVLCINQEALAETPLFNPPPKSSMTTPNSSSREDYIKNVQSLGEKNRSALSQQFQKDLPKPTQQPSALPMPTNPPGSGISSPITSPSPNPLENNQPPVLGTIAEPSSQTSAPVDAYTGFSNETPKASSTPKGGTSNSSGDGWNIQY